MSRINPNLRQPPPPKPEKPKAKGLRGSRLRPVSKDRAKDKRAHSQIYDTLFQYNPLCACDCGEPAEHPHHICSGTHARAASLYDSDTLLAVAPWCHDEKFNDALAFPVERQVALKFISILRKVNKYRGRAETAITMKDVLPYLNTEE